MHLSVNRRTALVILGVATALGVFSALQAFNYVSFFSERDDPFSVLLALNLTYWYTWALLAPFMLWMARRFRFERDGWLRSVSAHVGGVLVATFAHAIVTVTARVYIMQLAGGSRGRVVAGGARALLPLLRLGDDDLLGRHRRQPTRSTITASRRSAPSRRRSSRRGSPKRSSRRCSASCTRTSCSTRSTPSRR